MKEQTYIDRDGKVNKKFTTLRWRVGEPKQKWQTKAQEFFVNKKPDNCIVGVKILPLQDTGNTSCVYVLRSQTETDIVKIGVTSKDVSLRLAEINKQTIFYNRYKFEIDLVLIGGGQKTEYKAHKMLKYLNRHIEREAFVCSKEEIGVMFSEFINKGFIKQIRE